MESLALSGVEWVDDIFGYDKLVAAENWGAPRKRSGLVKPVLSEVEGAASRNEPWLCFYPQIPFVPIRTDSGELNYENRKSGGLVKLWATNQSEGSQLADSP